MNSIFRKTAFCLFLLIPLLLHAQTKVGHFNSKIILGAMPEMANANEKLDSLQKSYEGQLQKMIGEYKKAIEGNYDKKDKAETENRIRAFQDNAKKDIEAKSEELVAPIRERILKAVKEVAKEGNFGIVLDNSYDTIVLYADEKADLTDAVKKKLGL